MAASQSTDTNLVWSIDAPEPNWEMYLQGELDRERDEHRKTREQVLDLLGTSMTQALELDAARRQLARRNTLAASAYLLYCAATIAATTIVFVILSVVTR